MHCATRLRLVVKDESKIDLEKIESLDLVKGHFNNGGQFQIILGTGIVNKVYEAFTGLTNLAEVSKEEFKNTAATKLNPLQALKDPRGCFCSYFTSLGSFRFADGVK